MCDHSSSTFHYRNNTMITNNNHKHNHNHINYHNDNGHDDDDGHHNHHNNFITTKKKAARTKTSPGEFYFILFDTNKCFIVSTGCIYNIRKRECVGRPVMTKTGPNDARCVI